MEIWVTQKCKSAAETYREEKNGFNVIFIAVNVGTPPAHFQMLNVELAQIVFFILIDLETAPAYMFAPF